MFMFTKWQKRLDFLFINYFLSFLNLKINEHFEISCFFAFALYIDLTFSFKIASSLATKSDQQSMISIPAMRFLLQSTNQMPGSNIIFFLLFSVNHSMIVWLFKKSLKKCISIYQPKESNLVFLCLF